VLAALEPVLRIKLPKVRMEKRARPTTGTFPSGGSASFVRSSSDATRIGTLDLKASSVFLAAAAYAAGMITASASNEETSPGLETLAKTLETKGLGAVEPHGCPRKISRVSSKKRASTRCGAWSAF